MGFDSGREKIAVLELKVRKITKFYSVDGRPRLG
jgi:hypothetical protein